MTLTARRKPPPHHKKISGRHHRPSKNYHKPYLPYLPMLGIVIVGMLFNSMWPGKPSVLGYATDVSIQSLLDNTNAQRSNNGLSSLTLNTQLDQAAQAKAADMATRDYWSHNTPDGQTPWNFFAAAGYAYQTAGENLAYGFNTASDTVTGWMNSPEHRANILNTTYQEVGFGIINSPNYQGYGPETIVVALYAKPAPVATAPAPAPVQQTAPSPSPAPAASTPAPAPTSSSVPIQHTPAQTAAPTQVASVVAEPATKRVARVQLITGGRASWSLFVLSVVGSCVLALFFLRHGLAWHKVIKKGERFVLTHHWLDMAAVAFIVIISLLSRSSGLIK